MCCSPLIPNDLPIFNALKEIFKFGGGGRLPGIPGEGGSFFRDEKERPSSKLSLSSGPFCETSGAFYGLSREDGLQADPKFVSHSRIEGQTRLLVGRAPIAPQTVLREIGARFREGLGFSPGGSRLHHPIDQPHAQGFFSPDRSTGQD